MGKRLRHLLRLNNHRKIKTKLAKIGTAVLRLMIPINLTSAGLVEDAYQQSNSHIAAPILSRNKVWLKSALMNVAIFFNAAI